MSCAFRVKVGDGIVNFDLCNLLAIETFPLRKKKRVFPPLHIHRNNFFFHISMNRICNQKYMYVYNKVTSTFQGQYTNV
jgi:hypothetical protein